MTKYLTLMSSLPPLGQLFEASQEPISRLKLESRLKLLDEQDTATLDRLTRIIAWSQQPFDRSDADLLNDVDRFLKETRQATLRELVARRMDLRTITAALRRRHRGEDEAPTGQRWGFGPWVGMIERHWKEPTFRLEGIHPWVVEGQHLLEAKDWVGFERLQFAQVWKLLDQLGAGHYFDFEAVVIYINRWSLVARWSCYKSDDAVERFRRLVSSGLTQFTDVFSKTSP
jgi:hypothetical protein